MTLLAHSRLVVAGKIGGTQTWSTGIGLNGTDESAPAAATLQRFVDEFAPLVSTWFGAAVGSLNNSDVSLEKLILTSYLAGETKAHAVAEHQFAPVVTGGSTVQSLPVFTALVVTLLTGIPGRSGRGRMYLPMTTAPLANHQADQNMCTTVATRTATMLIAMATAETTGQPQLIPAVCGKTGNFNITSVKVDSNPDVQHRREDKIGALFSTSAAV